MNIFSKRSNYDVEYEKIIIMNMINDLERYGYHFGYYDIDQRSILLAIRKSLIKKGYKISLEKKSLIGSNYELNPVYFMKVI